MQHFRGMECPERFSASDNSRRFKSKYALEAGFFTKP